MRPFFCFGVSSGGAAALWCVLLCSDDAAGGDCNNSVSSTDDAGDGGLVVGSAGGGGDGGGVASAPVNTMVSSPTISSDCGSLVERSSGDLPAMRKLSSKSSDWLWLVLNDSDRAKELWKYDLTACGWC